MLEGLAEKLGESPMFAQLKAQVADLHAKVQQTHFMVATLAELAMQQDAQAYGKAATKTLTRIEGARKP